MNRRRMVGLGAAMAQDEDIVGSLAGGGAVETALGMIDFGLVAQPGPDGTLAGVFTLTDFTQPGNPTVLQSTQLNRLEALNDQGPNARQLIGWVSAAGTSALFLLQVDDIGGAGSGKDTFSLFVGTAAAPFLEGEEQAACDCADYSYSLEGTVVRGDIIVVTDQGSR